MHLNTKIYFELSSQDNICLKCRSFLSIPWRFSERLYSWSLITCIILYMDDISLWFNVCRFDYVQTFTGLVAGEFCRALLGLFPRIIVMADEISEVLFLVVEKFWRCFLNKELLLTFLEIWLEIRLSCQTSGSSWFQMDGSKIREIVIAPSLFHVPWGNQQGTMTQRHFILSTPFYLSLKSLKKKKNFKLKHFDLSVHELAHQSLLQLFLWWLVKYLKDVEYTN